MHIASRRLRSWPLGVTEVSLLVAVFALARVPHAHPPDEPVGELSVRWVGPIAMAKFGGEKSVGSGGDILAVEGSAVHHCQPALA
jgi:hypothetical protein